MADSVKLLSCFSPEEMSVLVQEEDHIVVIIDSNVKKLYGHLFPYHQIEFDASEKNKILPSVSSITEQLMEAGADRDSFILVVGGGITTDTGAFAASVYFRGVRFGLVPTTLLAQVDAAIGGKNGVNSNGYKNIIGTINLPEFTILCSDFLKTLPEREFNSGLAEMLKTLIIGDRESYFHATEILYREKNPEAIAPFIEKAAAIKAAITGKDLYEHGERKLLNLGHTFAHAIEKETGTSHGEAVAIGITLAAKLSVKLEILDSQEATLIESNFISLGINVKCPVPVKSLIRNMKMDKKKSGNTITFILIEKIGRCITYPVHIANLEEALYDLS